MKPLSLVSYWPCTVLLWGSYIGSCFTPWPYNVPMYLLLGAVTTLISVDAYEERKLYWAFLLALAAGGMFLVMILQSLREIGYFGVPQYS